MACATCGKRGKLVTCSQCQQSYHARCQSGSKQPQAVGSREQWKCSPCSTSVTLAGLDQGAGAIDTGGRRYSLRKRGNADAEQKIGGNGLVELGQKTAASPPQPTTPVQPEEGRGGAPLLAHQEEGSLAANRDLRRSKRHKGEVELPESAATREEGESPARQAQGRVQGSQQERGQRRTGRASRKAKNTVGAVGAGPEHGIMEANEERQQQVERDEEIMEESDSGEEDIPLANKRNATSNQNRAAKKGRRGREREDEEVEVDDRADSSEEQEADVDAGGAGEEGDAAGEADVGQGNDAGERARQRFLAIARRRAAHFAHFAGDVADGEGEAVEGEEGLAGGEAEAAAAETEEHDWPGPFSTARRLVEGRAAAAAARADAKGEEAEEKTKRQVVQWVPSRHKAGGTKIFGLPEIESLYQMCVKLVTEHAEYVESMVGIPDAVRKSLSAAMCARRKVEAKCLKLLLEGVATEIQVPDCSLVSEPELTEALAQCSPAKLESLELGLCGRCLSDQSLAATIASGPASLPHLTILSLRGAYRLSDKGLRSFSEAAPSLKHIELQRCSLITESGIEALADSLGSKVEILSLEGCTQLDGRKLLPAVRKLEGLRRVSLAGIGGLVDGVLSEILLAVGSKLLELNLDNCSKLTDVGVAAIGACCPDLQQLSLDNVTLLTNTSLARLADGCRGLRQLSLKRGRFSDEALAALVTASGGSLRQLGINNVRQAGDLTLVALAAHSHKSLEELDASWCRQLSDEGLGHLADSCASLRRLRLFGCSQITESFFQGHSNANLKIIGRGGDKE